MSKGKKAIDGLQGTLVGRGHFNFHIAQFMEVQKVITELEAEVEELKSRLPAESNEDE